MDVGENLLHPIRISHRQSLIRQKGSRSFYCNMNSNARWRSPKRTRRVACSEGLCWKHDGKIIPSWWFISASLFIIDWPLETRKELAQQMQEEKQRIEDMLRTLKCCPQTYDRGDRRAGPPQWVWVKTRVPKNWIAKVYTVPHMPKNCGRRL